jgi:hypothetical protein
VAKEFPPDELAGRAFVITMVSVALFAAAVFIFVI